MMNEPDFTGAIEYVRKRLQTELPARLTYHSLWHTMEEVLPAVERLGGMEGLSKLEIELLRTAACFHDIGFIERYQGHETAGARIAGEVLPGYSFSPQQINLIQSMILATRLPQSPASLMERILADADLDVLGRDDFLERNQALREELASEGRVMNDDSWYCGQLSFLQNHHYFTSAARQLREEIKNRNIQQLALIYQACQENQPES